MSITNQCIIVGLGELLWDLFQDGKQLGGAPANFAYWSSALGDRGVVASRVGVDDFGRQAIERLNESGVDTSHLQRSSSHPTGTARVKVSDSGGPDFTITENVAWDHLEYTEEWDALAERTDAVSFGTLARRSSRSDDTIRRFIQTAADNALVVFDVNLRQSFYSPSVISDSLGISHIAKLSDDEIPVVLNLLDVRNLDLLDSARLLLRRFDLELICVTRGAGGSLFVTDSELVEHNGIAVDVVDTVGSGDAFTAALVHHYLRGSPLDVISEAANRLGSLVSGRAGAMPLLDEEILEEIRACDTPE